MPETPPGLPPMLDRHRGLLRHMWPSILYWQNEGVRERGLYVIETFPESKEPPKLSFVRLASINHEKLMKKGLPLVESEAAMEALRTYWASDHTAVLIVDLFEEGNEYSFVLERGY